MTVKLPPKLISVVGARPQFIKLAPLARLLQKNYTHVLVHTGQHFDDNMSAVFFDEMKIPKPDFNLGIQGGGHGEQTGQMLQQLETLYKTEKPDGVIVFGDTNTTLAAALAASKLLIPVFHIEAGLRSYDKAMPEEQNRVLVDHLSDLLLCPTQLAIDNLKKEGISNGVVLTGDIMMDAVTLFTNATHPSSQFQDLLPREVNLDQPFAVLTMHRASNVDHKPILSQLVTALKKVEVPILFPVHPRTAGRLKDFEITLPKQVISMPPLGYRDMLQLVKQAQFVMTDSGGLQKEAFFLKTPTITFRDTSEWTETIALGWNTLVLNTPDQLDESKFETALSMRPFKKETGSPYGTGEAAITIVAAIQSALTPA